MRSVPFLFGLALLAFAASAPADEAGICGQWRGEIEFVRDTGDAQLWASQFHEGDALRGYFMKRGVPAQVQTTEVTNPWHQHVNTLELFDNHDDWAMNVNVNGFTFEHDSRAIVNSPFNLRVLRNNTDRIQIYGDRHDYVMWWTDWVKVSDQIEYFPHYSMSVRFEGSDSMLQTPDGISAGGVDLNPDLLVHTIGSGNHVEAYGVVQMFSNGGFDGSAQIAGRVLQVEQFPCSMVQFDAPTGQYGLVGGGD